MQKTQFIQRLLAVSVAAAMFGSVGAQAQTASTQMGASATAATASGTAKLTAADRKAIMDMAMSSMAEVEMGKMAQTKSQNADVKAFGQKMVDDHGKALAEVQTLAQSKGVTLPTELDAKHKALRPSWTRPTAPHSTRPTRSKAAWQPTRKRWPSCKRPRKRPRMRTSRVRSTRPSRSCRST